MTLVLDTAPLSAFARAGRLEVLDRLCGADARVTTSAVIHELRAGVSIHPQLEQATELAWLRVERLDTLEELSLFATYVARFGSTDRDLGEASVLAWAEAHRATAVTDDQVAVLAGRERGVDVKRTLSLVVCGIKEATLTEGEAAQLVDDLLAAGARYPFSGGGFIAWARAQYLLP